MKHLKVFLTVFVMIASVGMSTAQVKVAHINSEKLMEDLPQVKAVEATLQSYADAYKSRLSKLERQILEIERTLQDSADLLPIPYVEILQQEYQEKYQEYQRISQEFQSKLGQKQNELLQPVIADLKAVIVEVAKAKGFDYVLDSSEGGTVIYGTDSYDLMNDVKKRLAEIEAEKKAAAEGTDGQ